MRFLIRMLTVLFLIMLAACAPSQPLPTVVATATAVSPTATVTPTRTPFPSATATIAAPNLVAANPAQQAYVRFVHAAPELATIDLYVDNLNLIGFMEYTNYTEQSPLQAGDYTLTVVSNGRPVGEGTIVSMPLSLMGGDSAVVILSGTSAEPTLTILKEDLSSLSGAYARFTLFNAFSAAALTLNDGTLNLIGDTAYSTASPGTVVPAQEIALNLRSDGEIIYAGNFRVRERQNTTLIALPQRENPAKAQLIITYTDIPGVARVDAINMLDATSVDILLNDTVLGERQGYAYRTQQIELPATEYKISVYEAGVDRVIVEPIYTSNVILAPNEDVTLIFLGTAEDVRLLNHMMDQTLISFGKGRITFVNTLPEVPRAILQTTVDTEIVVPYGQVTEGGEFTAGNLPVTWYRYQNGTLTGDPLEVDPNFTVLEGQDILYLISGRMIQEALTYTTFIGNTPREQSAESLTPQAPTVPEPTIYALNALDGLTLNFRVDDVPLGAVLAPRTSNTGNSITEGERVVTALRSDTSELLARTIYQLQQGQNYVAVAFGRPEVGYTMMVTGSPLPPNPDNAPTIRLINISELYASMGLSIVQNTGNVAPFPVPDAVPQGENDDPFRTSQPIGVKSVVAQVISPSGSAIVPIPDGAGLKDIYIIDSTEGTASVVLPAVALEAGKNYDIIAFQSPFSRQVTAYVVPYLAP